MGKDKFLPFLAVGVLLFGSVFSLYIHVTTADSSTIVVYGTSYSLDQLFFVGEEKTIEIDGIMFSGVALDDLLVKTGVVHPESHEYTVIGADGYQKTVKWDHMKNGVFTREDGVVFRDLPKAFRVKDVVSIEVK